MKKLEKAIARRIDRAHRNGASSYASKNATHAAAIARMPHVQAVADRKAAKSGMVYVHGLGEVPLPEGVTVEEFQREVEAMQARVAQRVQEEANA